MALAIAKEVRCEEITEMEFSYAPPVSMVVDPIVLAAEDALDKMKSSYNTIPQVSNHDLQ